MLEASALTKRYSGVAAVEGVSFHLLPGQVLGCLGPNGSGKSTTVKMLTGLVQPSHGEVLFRGSNIYDDLVGYRKCLGYVPEETNLYPYLSGREYLELVATLRSLPYQTVDRKIDDLLALFSLHPHRHASLASYSKGMRQRVLLIAAILGNPEILILDEPLSGLDVISALVFRHLIKRLGELGRSVFYCSHVLEVAEKVCSHVLILKNGTVLTYAPVEEVRRNTGQESLEHSFVHLVEEGDATRITGDIVEVMQAA